MTIIDKSLVLPNVYYIFRKNGVEVKVEVLKNKLLSNFSLTENETKDLEKYLQNDYFRVIKIGKRQSKNNRFY